MSDNGSISDLEQRLSQSVEPVRAGLAAIEASINEHEEELGRLRLLRTKAKRLLSILDPETPLEKPKKKRELRAGNERRTQVFDFAVACFGGAAFSGPELRRQDGFEERVGVSSARLTQIIDMLHEEGRLRLDHIGSQSYPREKFFRVTADLGA